MFPGWRTFLVGNIPTFMKWFKIKDAAKYSETPCDPINVFMRWKWDQCSDTPGVPNSFDYGKHPVLMFNMNTAFLVIADPDIVQELWTTKNSTFDKTGLYCGAVQNFFGNSFLFSKADDVWKAKRKGLGHAFYKDKLLVLLETLKDLMLSECDKWKAEMQASSDGTTRFNMSVKFLNILQEFLLQILLGSRCEQIKIKMIDRKGERSPWETLEVSLPEAIMICFDQTLFLAPKRLMNPAWLATHWLTGKSFAFSKADRICDKNCALVRQEVRNYIQKRISGEIKSEVANNSDLVSLMLESKDIFDIEDIIDEVLDLMVAATNTQ